MLKNIKVLPLLIISSLNSSVTLHDIESLSNHPSPITIKQSFCRTQFRWLIHWTINLFTTSLYWIKDDKLLAVQGAASLTTLIKMMIWWHPNTSYWRDGLVSSNLKMMTYDGFMTITITPLVILNIKWQCWWRQMTPD